MPVVGIKSLPVFDDDSNMRYARNFKTLEPRQGGESRGCGRLRCELMSCDLGEVADISASGMRVKSKRKPPVTVGERMKLAIHTDGVRTVIMAEVVWLKKQGWFRHELGLRFLDVGISTRILLDQAVSYSVQRLTIADPV